MTGLYLTAGVVVLASLAVGNGILAACRFDRPAWVGGGVGYAALLLLASRTVRLPGAGTTTLVVLAAVTAGGLYAARRLPRPSVRELLEGGLLALVVLFLLGLPFLAAGHFGPLGVSLDNDLGYHVAWVDILRVGPGPPVLRLTGYPIGGESLAAALERPVAGGAEQALLGVGAAAVVLGALAALSALRRAPRSLRILCSAAVGIPYLVAAYFGEGSLKEVETATLVLVFGVLSLSRAPLRRTWPALAVVAGGVYACFGIIGLVWPLAILAVRTLTSLGAERITTWWRPALRVALPAVLAVVAVGAAYSSRSSFGFGAFRGTAAHPSSNLVRPLPAVEALGVWNGTDFRLPQHSGALSTLLIVLTVGALVAGIVVCVRARRPQLLVPAVACLVVYLGARLVLVPYDAAKALVIGGPALLLAIVAPLALRAQPRGPALPRLAAGMAAAGVAIAVLLTGSAALRGSPVDSWNLDRELQALRPSTQPVLFLGHDDWIQGDLRGLAFFAPGGQPGALRTPTRPGKPADSGAFDFDTVAAVPDYVHDVITTRTLDQSAPPENFRLVRSTAHFELWQRVGSAPPRQVLAEGSDPGAVLDCKTPAGRGLARTPGVAAVRTAPVSATPWRLPQGPALPLDPSTGAAFTAPGGRSLSTIVLPRGRWQLSISYQSPAPLTLRTAAATATLPATLEPLGPVYAALTVTSSGAPLTLELDVPRHPAPASHSGALSGVVQAVPDSTTDERQVPLAQACGRYVDWYRLTA